MRLSRRALLGAVGCAAMGCSRRESQSATTNVSANADANANASANVSANADADANASANANVLEWDLGTQNWGPGRAAIVVPSWGGANARYPVLVALHGRGEAVKPPSEGAMGWPRDYALTRAFDRLRAPPLRSDDYEGFVDSGHLSRANADLARQPFAGLIVACPYMPDLNPRSRDDRRAYETFLLHALLPRVRRDTPALSTPEATGIDGVSLGGAMALRIGLANPDAFGAVGALQPAIGDEEMSEWTTLARVARARRASLKLRLQTSTDDYFRDAIQHTSQAWTTAGVAHDFALFPGPHDYAFNRGPGSIEMLLWHDRALARS
jgi:hypothetical protein